MVVGKSLHRHPPKADTTTPISWCLLSRRLIFSGAGQDAATLLSYEELAYENNLEIAE
jgi:hypothetical protein